MAKVKDGDKVKVHYTGKLADGTVFDSSVGADPLEFTMGEGQLIAGFESAVMGMEPGQKVVTDIPSKDAYGPYRDELVLKVPVGDFPEGITPEVGMNLRVGDGIIVCVTEVSDEQVVLDGNPPLAGKDLTFEIEVVEIA